MFPTKVFFFEVKGEKRYNSCYEIKRKPFFRKLQNRNSFKLIDIRGIFDLLNESKTKDNLYLPYEILILKSATLVLNNTEISNIQNFGRSGSVTNNEKFPI